MSKKYASFDTYPLYLQVVHIFSPESPKRSPKKIKLEESKEERPPKAGWRRNYYCLTEEDRLEMKVDEILALYLFEVAQKTNENFLKSLLTFVILFREGLNEIGWNKKLESDGRQPAPGSEQD